MYACVSVCVCVGVDNTWRHHHYYDNRVKNCIYSTVSITKNHFLIQKYIHWTSAKNSQKKKKKRIIGWPEGKYLSIHPSNHSFIHTNSNCMMNKFDDLRFRKNWDNVFMMMMITYHQVSEFIYLLFFQINHHCQHWDNDTFKA